MYGRGRDLWIAPCYFRCVEDVGQFGLPVADPMADERSLLLSPQVCEVNAVAGMTFEAERCVAYNTDVSIGQ